MPVYSAAFSYGFGMIVKQAYFDLNWYRFKPTPDFLLPRSYNYDLAPPCKIGAEWLAVVPHQLYLTHI